MNRLALFLLFFFLLLGPGTVFAEERTDAGSSDALEMISERMRILSEGLRELPEPPDFDRKIMIPDLGPLVANKGEEKEEG